MLDWADDLPNLKDSIVHASGSSTALSPPQPSKEGAGTRTRPTTPRTLRPLRENLSSLNNPSVTPRSRKRLEDIETGLKQRDQDFSPTRHAGPSRERGPSTSYSSTQAIPQPPSPVPTEVDCEADAQPQKTYSFLGLHDSPDPIVSTIKDEGQPSTPKKQRLVPPSECTAIQLVADAISSGGGLLLTPPQSTRRVAQPSASEPESISAIMHNRKGKEREDRPPVQTLDQVSAHPFHYSCNIIVHAYPWKSDWHPLT